MFALPALSTPTLRLKMTPFTPPPTNYSKAKETPAPTALQRQWVSTKQLDFMQATFQQIEQSSQITQENNAISVVAKFRFNEGYLKELRKWSMLLRSYLSFFFNGGFK